MTETPQNLPQSVAAKTGNSTLRQLLTAGDFDGCITFVKQNKVSVVDASHLVEKLIHQNRLDDAFYITIDMLDKGTFPVQKIFR